MQWRMEPNELEIISRVEQWLPTEYTEDTEELIPLKIEPGRRIQPRRFNFSWETSEVFAIFSVFRGRRIEDRFFRVLCVFRGPSSAALTVIALAFPRCPA